MNMKRFTAVAVLAIAAAGSLVGCNEPATAEQKVQQQITEKVHALTADERLLAAANAKQFFEKEWPISQSERARGFFLDCRPSDSNFNGLVTCFGKVPNMGGGFTDAKRYCGYRPELSGCSDEDMVK